MLRVQIRMGFWFSSRRSRRVIWFRESSRKEGDRIVAWYKLLLEVSVSGIRVAVIVRLLCSFQNKPTSIAPKSHAGLDLAWAEHELKPNTHAHCTPLQCLWISGRCPCLIRRCLHAHTYSLLSDVHYEILGVFREKGTELVVVLSLDTQKLVFEFAGKVDA